MKPGYKTSELYMTLIPQIVGLLVIFGVLNAEEATTLTEALTQAIQAIAGLATAIVPLWRYLNSRTQIKTAYHRWPLQNGDD